MSITPRLALQRPLVHQRLATGERCEHPTLTQQLNHWCAKPSSFMRLAYTETQVLKIITDKGLRTKRRRELSAQTFDATLRKPIFAGWMYSSNVPVLVKSLHQPFVTQEIIEAVQHLSFRP